MARNRASAKAAGSACLPRKQAKMWDNRSGPGGAINTTRSLTHSLEPNSRSRLMPSIRTPKSVQRRDPAIYQDTAQHGDRLIALGAYRRGCRCDSCKGHIREERRRWREKHGSYQTSPERKREQNRAYLYGMKPEQYEQMRADQLNCCKICGEHKEEKLVVDHCHASGEIRGLLCARCNTLLGMAKDSETTLASAIEYLRQERKRRGA